MDERITEMLNQPLDRANVSQRDKSGISLSYIEGHHVIREANRIFGFDGWSLDVKPLDVKNCGTNAKGNVVYHAMAMVTVMALGVARTDVGSGIGIAKSEPDAIESATKEAVTDAMKRALRTFGDQFGNALYDKQQKHVADVLDDSVVEFIKTAKSMNDLKNVWLDKCKSDSRYTALINARKGELNE